MTCNDITPKSPSRSTKTKTSTAGIISEEYDEFKKQNVVYLKDMSLSGSLVLNAFSIQGSDSVLVILTSTSENWKYLKCYNVDWLGDDSPVLYQGQVSHEGTVGSGYVIEYISMQFTRDQFLTLASAVVAKGRICNQVFTFKEKQLSQMLSFAEKLQITSTSKLGGAICGNGLIEKGEQCDIGKRNSDVLADACRTDCTLPRCGDGIIDSIETCDDGNTTDGDGCPSSCVVALKSCGNGAVDPGEQCDDGSANSEYGPCLPLCKPKPR
jgi:cysteine-rich repeat protein